MKVVGIVTSVVVVVEGPGWYELCMGLVETKVVDFVGRMIETRNREKVVKGWKAR